MKITDYARLIKNFSVPAGTPVKPAVSVDSRDICEFIDILKKIRVEVDIAKSRKRLEFPGDEHDGFPHSIVPLNYGSDTQGVEISEYDLKANNLEIKLKNCFEKFPPLNRRIGGQVEYETGILGEIIFEGSYEEGAVVKRVKRAITDFYAPLLEDSTPPRIKIMRKKQAGAI